VAESSCIHDQRVVSDTEEAKATRGVREKIILPIEASTVVDDIDPEFVGGSGDVGCAESTVVDQDREAQLQRQPWYGVQGADGKWTTVMESKSTKIK
jgi:hypothetical protein